ncbi:MAG: VanZ family protein [Gemmatimonadota bacterium]
MNRMLAYVPALIWAGVLLFVGGRSAVPRVESTLPLDKAAHFIMYGVLGALVTLGWRRAGRTPRLLWLLVLASLVGVIDEFRQRAVATRSPEAADWVADSLGIAAAAWLVLRYTKETTKNVV